MHCFVSLTPQEEDGIMETNYLSACSEVQSYDEKKNAYVEYGNGVGHDDVTLYS